MRGGSEIFDDYAGGDGLQTVDFVMRSEHNAKLRAAQDRADLAAARAETDRADAKAFGFIIGALVGGVIGMFVMAGAVAYLIGA